LSFYYCERPKILDSTADQAAQAGCLPSGKRHVDPFPPLITKLPLAPKREFLAIPQGWRHKLQAKKKTPVWVLFYLSVSNTWGGFHFALWKLKIICGHCAVSQRNILFPIIYPILILHQWLLIIF
jgi:hypothetical protein